jgi:aminoglycoside phosphotransferase (APT) family kinase protein
MTADPAPTPGIDMQRFTAWVAGLGIGAVPPLRLARIGAGRSNLTFVVQDAGGRRWVARRPPLGRLLASAHDIAREHRILSGLAHAAVPAPRPIALSIDERVSSAPLLLMEYVDGAVLGGEDSVAELVPASRHALGLSLAEAIAAVHRVDLEATGLDTLASHAPYAARQLRRWRRQWHESRTRDAPAADALADRLERAIPEQREVVLVHGDSHLLNVIADPARGHVRALVDWELSTLGDPLADLGSLLAYWPQADDPVVTGTIRLSTLPGFATRSELVDAYAAASDRDLGALPFWHALGCWKTAVILEGVRRRMLDAGEDDEPIATAVVDDLLDRARRVADDAGL